MIADAKTESELLSQSLLSQNVDTAQFEQKVNELTKKQTVVKQHIQNVKDKIATLESDHKIADRRAHV